MCFFHFSFPYDKIMWGVVNVEIVREIVGINPVTGVEVVQYKCGKCGKVLAEVTYGSLSYMVHGVNDCEYFTWDHYGNRGWELYGDPSKYVMVLYDGTSVYALRTRNGDKYD